MSRDAVPFFQEAYRELRPRAPLPAFEVTFFPFSNINNTIRLRSSKVLVRISDLLEGAPEPILRAIAHILLAKLYRKEIDPFRAASYRKHIGSRRIAAQTHIVRQARGRKRLSSSKGQNFDLEQIFEQLNTAYFYGLLGRPQLSWSAMHSRTNLGHFDPAHNAIIVSKILDRPGIPRYAVEYLLYHEMLHLKYPVKLKGSRRCVHPAAFQEEERRFAHFEQAKKFLSTL